MKSLEWGLCNTPVVLVGMSICTGVERRCPMTIGIPIIGQAENAEIASVDHMYVQYFSGQFSLEVLLVSFFQYK